jgi:galactose mutarotase-like enzyme
MGRIERTRDQFARYHLVDDTSNTRATLVPERGALVTHFTVGPREVLFLDELTLNDLKKNVRGGIPILFPIAGKLAGETYELDGQRYGMKQHGFARNRAWSVVQELDAVPAITLGLRSDDETRAVFPFEFEVQLTFTVSAGKLTIDQSYVNHSSRPMPLHFGFHPYFFVPNAEKSRTTIRTDATQAFDNTRGVREPFRGCDLSLPEVDCFLLDHKPRESTLERPDRSKVTLEMDGSFSTLVVWTLADKEYVCLEPWSAPGNALNSREHLLMLGPDASHHARIAIVAS